MQLAESGLKLSLRSSQIEGKFIHSTVLCFSSNLFYLLSIDPMVETGASMSAESSLEDAWSRSRRLPDSLRGVPPFPAFFGTHKLGAS